MQEEKAAQVANEKLKELTDELKLVTTNNLPAASEIWRALVGAYRKGYQQGQTDATRKESTTT